MEKKNQAKLDNAIDKISKDIEKFKSKNFVAEKNGKRVYYASNMEKLPEVTKELYKTISDKILSLGPKITKINTKTYLSYKFNKRSFMDITPFKGQIKVYFNFTYGELDDKNHIARNVENLGHLGNGDYEVSIKPEEEEKLNHLFELIDQAYQKFKEIHQF